VTLASIAVGLTLSTVRWLLLDSIHHRTGLLPPPRNFARLGGKETAFARLEEDHYRYYQFYGNMLSTLIGDFNGDKALNLARQPSRRTSITGHSGLCRCRLMD
jgi:hypothetical protein